MRTVLMIVSILVLPGSGTACGTAAVRDAESGQPTMQERDYKAVSHHDKPLPIDPKIQSKLRAIWHDAESFHEQQDRMLDVFISNDGTIGSLPGDELGRQIIFHLANMGPADEKARRAPVLLWRLLRTAEAYKEFWPETAAIAAAPYLDTDDSDLRAAVQWLLYVGEVLKPDRGYRMEPAYGLVRDFFLRDQAAGPERELPEWLIEWMYKGDPPAAMNTYRQAFGLGGSGGDPARARAKIEAVKRAQLRVENHIALKIAGALPKLPPQAGAQETAAEVEPGTMEGLRELADNEHWRVRAYVVATMAKHPELRDPQLLKDLAKDSNEFVRKGVAGIAPG